MKDDPNLELQARFARIRAAELRRAAKTKEGLVERLSLKQLIQIRRRMPLPPARDRAP